MNQDSISVPETKKERKAHVSRSTGKKEWFTPPQIIDRVRAVFEVDHGVGIELDPASCAEANRIVRAKKYYDIESDGLAHDWSGTVWLNPPYSQPLIGNFVMKAVESIASGDIPAAIVLVNNGTETKWSQELQKVSANVCFPRGRIRFLDENGNKAATPLQGQMICYLTNDPGSEFEDRFREIGVVWPTELSLSSYDFEEK